MWNFLGGVAGALGSIYGAQQNAAAQNQANVFNYDLGVANLDYQKATQAQNIAEQEKFAQNAVQWKAADARAAGINPLAALGAPVMSFSNTVAPQNTSTWQAGSPGAGFSQAGQSLGRAIAAIQSPEDRAASALNLEHASLQNDLLRSQIAQLNSPSLGAGVPALSPPVREVKVDPDKVTAADPSGVATAGVHPEVSFSRTASGYNYPEPSHDLSVAMFNPWSQMSWSARNMLLPMIGYNKPPGMENYDFDPFRGYVPQTGQAKPGTWGYYLDRNKWFGETFQY